MTVTLVTLPWITILISSYYSSYTFSTFPRSYSTFYNYKSSLTKLINQSFLFQTYIHSCFNFLFMFSFITSILNDTNDFSKIYHSHINMWQPINRSQSNLQTHRSVRKPQHVPKHTLRKKPPLRTKATNASPKRPILLKHIIDSSQRMHRWFAQNSCKFERSSKEKILFLFIMTCRIERPSWLIDLFECVLLVCDFIFGNVATALLMWMVFIFLRFIVAVCVNTFSGVFDRFCINMVKSEWIFG